MPAFKDRLIVLLGRDIIHTMLSNIKNKFGFPLALVFSFIPAVLWVVIMPVSARFVSSTSIFTSLGQLAGLVGMAMFCVTIVLNMRLKFFEDWFGGMNRVYIAHHTLGAAAFVLLLFHPLFLAIKYALFSVVSAAFFLLSTDAIILFGIGALLSMMLFLVFTFFIKLPYQWWRFTHRFMAASFFLACLHVYYISSDISSSKSLRAYMFFLVVSALSAVCYRVLFFKLLVKRYAYSVEKVTALNDKVVEIRLIPGDPDDRIVHIPGQFVFISFSGSAVVSPEIHPFSISSGEGEPALVLTIKNLGDYTMHLKDLVPGTSALIEGPYGRFSYRQYPHTRQIWVAGGVGITPFLSMAKSFEENDITADLYYSVNDQSEAVGLSDLMRAAEQNKGLKIIPFYAKEKGFLTAAFIAETSKDIRNKEIFLCGPPPFMAGLKKQFSALGVAKRQIHSEEFNLM
jgi:predicted ferric reductase